MSYFEAKSLIALLFMGAGVTALVSMLTLMGRSERRLSVLGLRATHRTAGYVFAALLVVAAVMGLRYLAAAGDGLALRGVIHWVVASLLAVVLGLKILIVRAYKQFLKFVPVFGLIVFSLAFVVVFVSAVFFLVTGGAIGTGRPEAGGAVERPPRSVTVSGDPARGQELFVRHCSSCHHADSEEAKIGPGLAGLPDREELASTGAPATPENVQAQIVDPVGTMPSFATTLSQDDLRHLLAYLAML
jgi:mono/diheme cytochrome c family protein